MRGHVHASAGICQAHGQARTSRRVPHTPQSEPTAGPPSSSSPPPPRRWVRKMPQVGARFHPPPAHGWLVDPAGTADLHEGPRRIVGGEAWRVDPPPLSGRMGLHRRFSRTGTDLARLTLGESGAGGGNVPLMTTSFLDVVCPARSAVRKSQKKLSGTSGPTLSHEHPLSGPNTGECRWSRLFSSASRIPSCRSMIQRCLNPPFE